jgi:hypothetical protein
MGRPRSQNVELQLPPRVYLKHGAYHFVDDTGRWHRQTRDAADIERALAAAVRRVPATMAEVERYARSLVARSRCNARSHGSRSHDLTAEAVVRLLWRAGWRCAVSGTPFSMAVVGPRKQRPYAPSIDRIDNDLGYTEGNCRMVCIIVNIAMNTWGPEALRHVAKHMRNEPEY